MTGPAAAAHIKVESLSKSYDDQRPLWVLDDIDLQISAGQFVSIIGPSGCGKSTLIELLAGLQQPSSGSLNIAGLAPQEARRQRKFSLVFQKPVLYPWRSIARNVALPLELTSLSREKINAQTDQILLKVGLSAFRDHLPAQLSGGMQQLAAVARALITSPEVLFLDEPFSALDELTRETMNLELLRILESSSQTVLMVTHSISEAVFLSDRVIVMSPRPGHITATIDIPLVRPRLPGIKDTQPFFDLTKKLHSHLSSSWIRSRVIKGFGRGRELGFPTLNLDISAFPYRHGVYAAQARIGQKSYKGVLHYGPQATFDGHKDWIEIHLLDLEDEIKADTIDVLMKEYLRPPIKFSSKEELVAQMKKDCQQADSLLQ